MPISAKPLFLFVVFALSAFLIWEAVGPQAAQAQYKDGNGTTVQPSVPLACSQVGSGWTCSPVTSSNPLTTGSAVPSAIIANSQTVTTSAAALPSNALTNGVVLTAGSANAGTVYVGPAGVTTSTGYPLVAGQSISYAVSNTSAIYVLGVNTTDTVKFTGN
jgi:hypothetical protein